MRTKLLVLCLLSGSIAWGQAGSFVGPFVKTVNGGVGGAPDATGNLILQLFPALVSQTTVVSTPPAGSSGLISFPYGTAQAPLAGTIGLEGPVTAPSSAFNYQLAPVLPTAYQVLRASAPVSGHALVTPVSAWTVAVPTTLLTGQSGSISASTSTTVYTPPASGPAYRFCITAELTQVSGSTAPIGVMPSLGFVYTSSVDNNTKYPSLGFGTNSTQNATYISSGGCSGPFYPKGATPIEYSTSVSAQGSGPVQQYDLIISLEIEQ